MTQDSLEREVKDARYPSLLVSYFTVTVIYVSAVLATNGKKWIRARYHMAENQFSCCSYSCMQAEPRARFVPNLTSHPEDYVALQHHMSMPVLSRLCSQM